MADKLTRDRFFECLNTPFRVLEDPQAELELNLAQVSELSTNQNYEMFSLVFDGPAEYPLRQRIYRLEHDQLGSLELFLVPVGRDKEVYHYEAVFNRML